MLFLFTDCAHLHCSNGCCLVSSSCWFRNRQSRGGKSERWVRILIVLAPESELHPSIPFSLCRKVVTNRFRFEKCPNDRAKSESYPFWMVIFSGVAVIVAGLLHAAFWKPFSMIFGAIVSCTYYACPCILAGVDHSSHARIKVS